MTVERGCRNNARNISCIPNGEYIIRAHQSPRFGLCIKVFDIDGKSEVPGRSQILFHIGNYVNFLKNGTILNDTDGCILPVTTIATRTATGVFGASSAPRLSALQTYIGNESLRLIIYNEGDREVIKHLDTVIHTFLCPHCNQKLTATKGGKV
jgi:hypothetical protein